MGMFSVWLLVLPVCSVLWAATQGLNQQNRQPGQFAGKCHPYIPDATPPQALPQCPVTPPATTAFPPADKLSAALGNDTGPCDSYIDDIEDCMGDLFSALWSDKMKFDPAACCKAITEVSHDCMSSVLPESVMAYMDHMKVLCSVIKHLG